MKIYILLFAFIVLGCEQMERNKSELKNEQGVVIEKQYSPDTRQTITGTGFSTGGDMVFTSHSMGEDERFIVVFKCDHGVVFSINSPDLYTKLKKDDIVQIDYYEVTDGNGKLVDLDFSDANMIRRTRQITN